LVSGVANGPDLELHLDATSEAIDRRLKMRFLYLYLVGYFILLFGAALALWQSGILDEIPGVWIVIAAVIAVGLGIMLAVASGRPAVTTSE
jgi:hypothetical protein